MLNYIWAGFVWVNMFEYLTIHLPLLKLILAYSLDNFVTQFIIFLFTQILFSRFIIFVFSTKLHGICSKRANRITFFSMWLWWGILNRSMCNWLLILSHSLRTNVRHIFHNARIANHRPGQEQILPLVHSRTSRVPRRLQLYRVTFKKVV